MNRISNPFSPGAGSPPPELVGRNDLLEKTEILLARVKKRRAEKSFLMTGLRGVGKTVLLNEMEHIARKSDAHTIYIEAHHDKSLISLLAPNLRSLLFELNRKSNVGKKAKQALVVLKSFVNSLKITVGDIELGLDLEAEPGLADSGDLELDLPALFIAVAEAAQEQDTLIALFIDEIQYTSQEELSALVMAMHRLQQRSLPLVLVGAGLSFLPGLIGESKSYAERLFDFPEIGALSESEAYSALQSPVQSEGIEFEEASLKEIYQLSHGYPYFLQEWGYQAWNYADSSPISLEDIQEASMSVLERLDKNFFRVRFDRLTPKERDYLLAMAQLGEGPYKTGRVAEQLGSPPNQLAKVRGHLISKGMIFSPAYGLVAFTVPLFDRFMRRHMG